MNHRLICRKEAQEVKGEVLFASSAPFCGHSYCMTILEALIQSLSRAGEYNRKIFQNPVAIFTDVKNTLPS